MADLIHLALGTPPWAPAHDANVVRIYHQYDMPLLGLVRQHSVDYLFRCIAGEVESFNLWSYTTLSADDVEHLEKAAANRDQDEMDDLVEAIALSRSGVVAVAIEVDEVPSIVLFVHHEDAGSDAFVGALRELQAQLDQYMDQIRWGQEAFGRTLLAT